MTASDITLSAGRAASGRADRTFSEGQFDPAKTESTAEAVAEELGVSPKTVKRNGQRAEVHDAMLEAGDAEAAASERNSSTGPGEPMCRLPFPRRSAKGQNPDN